MSEFLNSDSSQVFQAVRLTLPDQKPAITTVPEFVDAIMSPVPRSERGSRRWIVDTIAMTRLLVVDPQNPGKQPGQLDLVASCAFANGVGSEVQKFAQARGEDLYLHRVAVQSVLTAWDAMDPAVNEGEPKISYFAGFTNGLARYASLINAMGGHAAAEDYLKRTFHYVPAGLPLLGEKQKEYSEKEASAWSTHRENAFQAQVYGFSVNAGPSFAKTYEESQQTATKSQGDFDFYSGALGNIESARAAAKLLMAIMLLPQPERR